MDIDDYWTAVKKIKRQEKEIESLRHNLEAASRETSRLSTELIEWKRRARESIDADSYPDSQWLKEIWEKDDWAWMPED